MDPTALNDAVLQVLFGLVVVALIACLAGAIAHFCFNME